MFERNGVVVFEDGDKEAYPDHPAYHELQKVSLGDVRFPAGFFIVDEDGETYVRPATEAERESMLLKVFPDGLSDTLRSTSLCYSEGPRCKDSGCARLRPRHACFRGFDESLRQFGCWCDIIE